MLSGNEFITSSSSPFIALEEHLTENKIVEYKLNRESEIKRTYTQSQCVCLAWMCLVVKTNSEGATKEKSHNFVIKLARRRADGVIVYIPSGLRAPFTRRIPWIQQRRKTKGLKDEAHTPTPVILWERCRSNFRAVRELGSFHPETHVGKSFRSTIYKGQDGQIHRAKLWPRAQSVWKLGIWKNISKSVVPFEDGERKVFHSERNQWSLFTA